MEDFVESKAKFCGLHFFLFSVAENENLYILACIFRNTYSKETDDTIMVFQNYQNIILEHLTLKLGENWRLHYNQ